jgi:large subunit ribosomal protein L24
VNKIKQNDTVLVTKGKDRGKQGQVRKVITAGSGTDKYGRPDPARLIVTGVNMVKRHMKPRGQNKPGGIIEREAPISWANAALICTACARPVRVGFRVANERKVRYCKSCDANID